MSKTDGTLLPPIDIPPTLTGPEDEFEENVPRPPVAWGVYIEYTTPAMSGFFADGYLVPDLFATRGDAANWIKRLGPMTSAKIVSFTVSPTTLTALEDGAL